MREIKFRAFNLKLNIMVYENEDDSSDDWNGVNLSKIEMVNYQISDNAQYKWMVGFKIGNKYIYDGDIIKNKVNEIFTVYLDKGCLFIHPVWFDNDKNDVALYSLKNIHEVIGNIYENKELLNN